MSRKLIAIISVLIACAICLGSCMRSAPGADTSTSNPTSTGSAADGTPTGAPKPTEPVTDGTTNDPAPTEPATDSTPTGDPVPTEPSTEDPTEDEWVIQNRVIPDVIPEFDEDSMTVYTAEEALEKIPFPTTYLPTYRSVYYWAPTYLIDLVDRDEFNNWYKEIILPNTENNIEPQEMYTVSFVKHFKISKEDFKSAEERRRLRFEELRDVNGDDISTETYEIYNADIIYTFDNEIINNYYRRSKYIEKTFTDASHENSIVKITYPEFHYNGIDDSVNEVILGEVEQLAQKGYGDDYKDLSMYLEYKVFYTSDKFISMYLKGSGYIQDSIHPSNIVRTITLSSAGESIPLDKVILIDDALVDTVNMHIENDLDENQSQYIKDRIMTNVRDEYWFKNQLSKVGHPGGSIQYNISDGYIILYIPVAHILGDYAEVHIPIEEVTLTDEFSHLGENA